MRFVSCAGAAVAAIVLAGCGASDEDAWNGPPDPERDGSVSVEAFETYRESVEEQWETASVLIATQFVRLSDRPAGNTSIVRSGASEGDGPETVTITLGELLDDAVRAERWVLAFEPAGDGFRLVSATRTQRCQPGRGHETFAPEPCR